MLIAAALLVLWVLVVYLAVFGLVALIRPKLALSYLFGFAQTHRANTVEGVARFVAGCAFIVADRPLAWSPWSMTIGIFLAVSALALLLFPELHKKVAPRLVAKIGTLARLLGLASMALSGVLALALVAT